MTTGRITMFTGKGGVGKTTCAAAMAVRCAAAGEKTLAISTDATPSLSHIFGVAGDQKPAQVQASLYIHELGEAEVRQMWHEKFGREVYEVFNSFVDVGYEEFVEFMTSVLPGLSDEFMVDYIRELYRRADYDAIIWDTAPLGQTLALLETPALLEKHLRLAPRVYSRLKLGPQSREPVLGILQRWEKLSAENMAFLRNRVQFIMVTIPEALAVAQLERVFGELGKYGLRVQQLIVNNVIQEESSEFLRSKARLQKQYREVIHKMYAYLPVVELPLFPDELKGAARLAEVAKILFP